MAIGEQTNYFVHTLLRARDWQHRPQLDEVCAWWRDGGRGVCALVGMGGAGKTAVAERFLRTLPGGLPDDPDVAKDESLPKPHSTFVFSFYDAPNPEAFFEALQMWLEHTPRIKTVLAVAQLLFLLQRTPGLVVLDGLEKVQDDGSRGVFGRLTSPKLRDFLDHLASGYVSELGVLLTSRFPLADLRDARPQFFHKIPIEEIDVATGIQLLRDRGVRGSDLQLEPIVEECGRHALTVDWAGGYIAEYGQGDPATQLSLGTAEELQAAAEQEADDDKRAVLIQGYRFARIAERYREAMLKSDEAALALLERICLFRLGVDCETLAAIFTGTEATKVSGNALAALDAKQLQKKLDWLVRMRIVEQSESPSLLTTDDSILKTIYSIHPAVRDGFLSGIDREAATASHEAIRKGLEVSLGETPGETPSDPATLDLLEEIIHHTLQSGHMPEAWDIYQSRIGGYRNLLQRLGAYERGERICRAFAGGTPPEFVADFARIRDGDQGDRIISNSATTHDLPYHALLAHKQGVFINDWALYLSSLGRLVAAARCYDLGVEMAMQQEEWANASRGKMNLCEVWLLSGRLAGSAAALSTAADAIQLAESADSEQDQQNSHSYRAHTRALRGQLSGALADFRAALEWQHKVDGIECPLYSTRGTYYAELLLHLGRYEEAQRLTEANKKICLTTFGPDDQFTPKCNLVLSDLPGESLEASSRESLCRSAQDWAAARDAKDILCWSGLVQARLELGVALRPERARHDSAGHRPGSSEHENPEALEGRHTEPPSDLSRPSRAPDDRVESCSLGDAQGYLVADPSGLKKTDAAIAQGLKIARDCGYGLFHIDLLLERVRLHLLRGNPQSALNDIELALDGGIAVDEETGQPELLAANHEECGYAWAIPAGLHLRGEAQLLAAAQQLASDSFVPAKQDGLPDDVQTLIESAKSNLNEALAKWQPLHDPEPEREDQNFKHPKTGDEYNFRAAETWQILQDLAGGVLTKYLQQITVESESKAARVKQQEPPVMSNRFHVALSFPGEHRSFVLDVAKALADKLTRSRVFYDEWYEAELLGTGGDLKLQSMYMQADLVVPFFSEHYSKPWCSMEWETIRGVLLNRRNDDAVIPVHLDDTDIPGWSPVNFGIRLRGRNAQQIAEVILQALEIRNAGDSATGTALPTAAGTPAPDRSPATPAASVSKTSTPPASGALAIWRERLDYLQQQEAIVSDPGQKFALKKQIEESKQKIKELGG